MINVNKLDSSEVSALNRLREPGIDKVITILQGELEDTKQKLVYANEMDIIHRLQGEQKLLKIY